MKKGQSALEFLMTYGWAFLVILIMIGALAYFGVLNPQKFLPDRCNFGTQINCNTDLVAVKALASNTVVARLVNGVGQKIQLYNVQTITPTVNLGTCIACLSNPITTPVPTCGSASADKIGATAATATNWDNGAPMNLVLSCTGGNLLSAGTKVRLEVNGNWMVSGADAAFAKPLAGEIYASVQ